MIVSWNELQRTCQKAFRGLGVPAGADDDGATAVLWLQARGFDALTPLEAALTALQHTPRSPLQPRKRAGGVDVLDAGGQPAVSVASDALDFAVARTVEREARVEVLLTGVDGGVLVAGALPQRPTSGRCARVRWWEGDTPWGLDVAANGERRLCTAPVEDPPCNREVRRDSVRIVIDEPGEDRWVAQDASWRIVIDDTELERRAMNSVTRGLEVPDTLWTYLLALAKRTLVPATSASRERGAGGGDYND